MTYATLLINTATIQRYTAGAQDAYGNPAKTWANHLVAEPCRLASAGGREVQAGTEVVIADYQLFLGDVDVTEQDRVIVDGVTYEILLVENRQDGVGSHHKETLLRVVR